MSKHEDLEPTRPSGRSGPAAESGLPEALRQLLGRELAGCTIERLLGKGDMGAVFLGYERSLGRRVAIKVLLPKYAEHPEFLHRFENEARAAAGLSSDRIVKVHRHGREGKFPFVVMELVEGGTLLQQNDGKPPAIADVVAQLKQACDGLLAVEEKKLVHRDIKPANVMLAHKSVGRDGRPRQRTNLKIVDFGIARPTSSDTSSTQPGTFVGSPLYASPEQCRGDTVSHLSDMYSLGSTFYHLLTGRPAAQGRNEYEVRAWTLNAPCLRPRAANPDVPENLDAVIAKMTDRDPAKRYASFADVIDALTAIEEGWRKKDVVLVEAPPKRWPLVLAGVMAVLLVGGAVLAHFMWPPPDEGGTRAARRELERLGGELGARKQELDGLLKGIPESCSKANAADELRAVLARVRERIEGLTLLRGQSATPNVATSDWAQALDKYRTSDDENKQVARLSLAVRDLVELDKKYVTLEKELATYGEGTEKDLADIGSRLQSVIDECTEKQPTFQDLADRGVALRGDLVDFFKIADREKTIDQALLEFEGGVQDVDRLLRKLPFTFEVRESCTKRFDQLERRLNAARHALQQTHLAERALQDVLTEFARESRSITEIGSVVDELSRRWPNQYLLTTPQMTRWVERAEPRLTRDLCDLIKRKIDDMIRQDLEAKSAIDWVGVREKLSDARVVNILRKSNGCIGQLSDKLNEAVSRMAKPKTSVTPEAPSPPPLPKDWPTEWPAGFVPPEGLKALPSGDRTVYRFRNDDVDMVLVKTAKPFLVDVRQVTYGRFCPRNRPLDPEFWWVSRRINPKEAPDCLLVYIAFQEAEQHAKAMGKDLMTDEDWKALWAALQPTAPAAMAKLAEKVAASGMPMPHPWPGPAPALAGFEVGVREIVRTLDGGFRAVGHSLFEPRDEKLDDVVDRVRYYTRDAPESDLTPTTRLRQLGFRCVLRLQPRQPPR